MFPSALPLVSRLESAHHAKLGKLLPTHPRFFAPIRNLEIPCVSPSISRFFMRIKARKGCLMPNAIQNVREFTRVYFDTPAQGSQMVVQHLQGFANKFKVLECAIGLQPQPGFNHVNTAHRPFPGGLGQGAMVLPAQVAFKPDQAVAHALFRQTSPMHTHKFFMGSRWMRLQTETKKRSTVSPRPQKTPVATR